jgi:hypothetical protein
LLVLPALVLVVNKIRFVIHSGFSKKEISREGVEPAVKELNTETV